MREDTPSRASRSLIRSSDWTHIPSFAMAHSRDDRLHDASNFDDFMLAAVSAMLIAAILVV